MNNIKGGGIMLPYSKQELSKKIFTYYLNNFVEIKTISYGRYGIVVLLLLPENIDTSNEDNFYKQLTPNQNYGKIVKSLLIKIQFVNNNYNVKLGDHEFTGVTEKQIQDEINIQTDIFFKTLNYMQPLCPSIIYADILKDFSEKQNILNLLRKAQNLPFPVENNIIYNNDFGIIVMEMIHNSKPLFKYLDDTKINIYKKKDYINNLNKSVSNNTMEDSNIDELNTAMKTMNLDKKNLDLAENISRYALLKLALDTGYGHNDFHVGNILIQEDKTYFKNIDISPILIDFGRTTKLNLDILNTIKTKVQQKNYIGALSELCKPYNTKLVHTRTLNVNYFGWVCGDYEGQIKSKKLPESVNTEIDQLFEKRELAIDENIQTMSRLHDSEPNKYPLLPLSNEIKNKLYNGMIGGKRNRKRKRKCKTKKNKLLKKNKTNRRYRYSNSYK
jgi:hypothetical protein